MNLVEATQLLMAMSALDPFARKRTEDEVVAIAGVVEQMLPNADLPWALAQVQAGLRHGQVPTLPELAAAWQVEAKRRVESVPVPSAPPEIEDDPVRWQAWERTRRSALIAGQSEDVAIAAADRQVGLAPDRRQITGRSATSQSAKEEVFRKLREWDRKQRLAQYEAEHPYDAQPGGEQE